MPNKIKLCFISGEISPHTKCGVSNYTYKLIQELNTNKNLDISIISSKNDFLDDQFNYINIENWNFSNWKNIKKAINKFKPQIIHYQHPTKIYGKNLFQFFIPYLIKKEFANIKVLTTIHEFSESPWYAKLWLIFLIKKSDYLIFTNQNNLDYAKKSISLKNKAKVIYIGSNIEVRKFNNDQIVKERKKILGDKKYLIGYFGFIEKNKGIDDLINSLNILVNQANKPYKLLIIAALNNKYSYHRYIEKLTHKYSLQSNVYITGYLEETDVSKYLQMIDLGVLPFKNGVSLRRGSLIAMLLHNVPVISSNNDFIDNLLQNNKNILLFSKIDDLTNKIPYLLENKKLYNKIKNGTKKIKTNFEWSFIAKNTYDFYMEMLTN